MSATIGATKLVLKDCTACYDLFVEFPRPTEDANDSVTETHCEVGMRVVNVHMVADLTLYQAIPGLFDALPRAWVLG